MKKGLLFILFLTVLVLLFSCNCEWATVHQTYEVTYTDGSTVIVHVQTSEDICDNKPYKYDIAYLREGDMRVDDRTITSGVRSIKRIK